MIKQKSGIYQLNPEKEIRGYVTILWIGLFLLILNSCGGQHRIIIDQNLEDAIRNEIDKPEGDLDLDDLEGLTELRAEDAGVRSLEGIQHCENLEHIILDFNEIDDISNLTGLSELKYLSLYNNNVNDISPLADIPSLEHLSIGDNPVYDLQPLENLPNLSYIFICSCPVRDLTPLINNQSFDNGDELWICDLPPNSTELENQIQALELKGVFVFLFE